MMKLNRLKLAAVVTLGSCGWVGSIAGLTLGSDYRRIVADAGAGAYEAFPDITRMSDGRLIAVFYAGYDHVSLPNASLPKGGRISYALSSDNGYTWSTARTLLDSPLDDRDSSITQLADGRLSVNFFQYPSGNVFVTYSSDSGKTWTPEQQVMNSYATSSPIREISPGNLILPMYRSVGRSTNNGASWLFTEIPSATPGALGHGLTETDVAKLNNGNLYAIHRADNGNPMHYTISTDNGVNWGSTLPLGFQGHAPYLLPLNSGTILLAYRDPVDASTKMRVSTDQAATWGPAIVVDTVEGAYASMRQLPDDSVFITYYEEGAGSSIRGRRFTMNGSSASFQSMSKTAQGTTLYHEIFSRGASSSIQNYGWHFYRHDGSTLHTEVTLPSGANIANSSGAGLEGSDVNSNPVTGTSVIGYLFMGGSGSGASNLVYTNEYALDADAWERFTLQWQNSGDAANESFRPAVKIGNNWYVTTDDVSAVNPGNWAQGRITVESELYRWSLLTVSASGMTIAAQSGSLPFGDIGAFGLLNQGQLGNLRIDNFRVTASAATPGVRWIVDASGNWTDTGNWSGASAPNGMDAAPVFGSGITSSRTIVVDSAVTVGSIRFDSAYTYAIAGTGSLTVDVNAGSGLFTVLQGSHKINLPLYLNDNTVADVGTGATLEIADPLFLNGKTLSKTGCGTLSILSTIHNAGTLALSGGVVTAQASLGSSLSADMNAGTLRLSGSQQLQTLHVRGGLAEINGVLKTGGLTLAGGQLILQDGAVLIDYAAGNSPYLFLQAAIATQLARGSGNADMLLVLGDAGDLALSAFAGESVDSSTLILAETILGDATLDRLVDSADFNVMAGRYGQTENSRWTQGDFNFDGKVNTLDFNLLAGQFGRQGHPSVALGATVPEPVGSSAIALLASIALRRSRARWAGGSE